MCAPSRFTFWQSIRGGGSGRTLARSIQDEHELVRETAAAFEREPTTEESRARRARPQRLGHGREDDRACVGPHLLFASARRVGCAGAPKCLEDEYAADEALCVQGESGNEVFILLAAK